MMKRQCAIWRSSLKSRSCSANDQPSPDVSLLSASSLDPFIDLRQPFAQVSRLDISNNCRIRLLSAMKSELKTLDSAGFLGSSSHIFPLAIHAGCWQPLSFLDEKES